MSYKKNLRQKNDIHRGKIETEKIKTLMVEVLFVFYFINKILIKKQEHDTGILCSTLND